MRARVYLRQNLFSLAGEAGHLPTACAIVAGELVAHDAFGAHLRADTYEDEKGRKLQGAPRTLLIPVAKIDHVWIDG